MNNLSNRDIGRSLGWTLLIGFACLTGCKTTDQANSGKLASVTISGRSKAEIQHAVAGAFLSNGYQPVDVSTFEKQGTGWDKMAYGGWSSNPVWIRMRINIISTGAGESILACDAYAVVDRNDATMEEEKKLSVSYSSDCKKILDQAKAALDAPPDKGAH